ncbi:MAG: LamG domain-containing protein [Planctomycetota bacterium]|jgi:hypothetical protein
MTPCLSPPWRTRPSCQRSGALRRTARAGLSAFLVVAAGCSTRPDGRSDAKPEATAVEDAAAKRVATTAPKAPARAATPAERELAWVEKRAAGRPVLCYLFGEGHEEFLPLPVGIAGKLYEAVRAEIGADSVALVRSAKPIIDLGFVASGPVASTVEGVRIDDGGRLVSSGAGRVLTERFRAEGAFTLEAIVTPADAEHSGPARIVGVSWDGQARNFTLGQERSRWGVRMRTSAEDRNGHLHEFHTEGLVPERVHVAVTFDGRAIRLYVDGRLAEKKEGVDGDLDAWDPSFPLILGNESRDTRDWAGVVRFVAFYDRALTTAQVAAAAADPPPGDASVGGTERVRRGTDEVF